MSGQPDHPLATVTPAPLAPAPRERCAYCGAPLLGEFYFCVVCATPYKAVSAVLPPVRLAGFSEGEIVRRKTPQVWTLFWTYLGVLIGAALVGFFAFGESQVAYALILSTTCLFVTTCVFGAIHWRALAVQLRRLGLLRWEAWAGIGMLVPLLALNFGYHATLRSLGAKSGLEMEELARQGVTRAAIIILFCIFPAVLEEVAFRGLLQHWLQVALRPWRAILLASALFTILHFSVLSAPYIFLVGMLLGWTKWKTASLYPSMVIHFLHNFGALAVFG